MFLFAAQKGRHAMRARVSIISSVDKRPVHQSGAPGFRSFALSRPTFTRSLLMSDKAALLGQGEIERGAALPLTKRFL